MIYSSTFMHKLITFVTILIILSYSGCVSKLESENLDETMNDKNIVLITNLDELRFISNSNGDLEFNKYLIPLMEKLEDNNYGYNQEMASEAAYIISCDIDLFNLKPIDVNILEEYSSYTSEMSKVNRIIDTLNENTDLDFERIPIDVSTHNKFIQKIDKSKKYVPVINSYNELINSSYDVLRDRTNEMHIRKFYIAAFLLGVDIVFIQSGSIHKTAFQSVGKLNVELKLMNTVPYLGYSGYGFLLSTIYWTLRGYIEGFKNDVFSTILYELPEDIRITVNLPSEESIKTAINHASVFEMEDVEKVKNIFFDSQRVQGSADA